MGEILSVNEEQAQELHKPVIKKIKRRKVYDNCVIKVLKLELVIESGLLNTRKLTAKLTPKIGQEKYSLLIPS